jgi:putative nucleotidyltransferase-like protein
MKAEALMPPAKVVQEALRATTERLAHELARPTEIAPSWSEFEWRAARAAVAIHGVGPLLARSLRWCGPPGWQTFLEDQRAQTEKRHRRIEALARLIDGDAREAGIPMVALKGAALHELGLYQAGERPMADLDLLVEDADTAGATKLLETRGFHTELSFWKNRVFKLEGETGGGLGEQCDNPIKVELHWRIRERLPLELTDISQVVFPANPRPGINPYPSRVALLMHLVLHAAGAMASRDLRLVHVHDLALVCREMHAEEWKDILCQGESGTQSPWWFLPPLQLASRYYPNIVPGSVLLRLQSACPARLRRTTTRRCVTDFSLSSVWASAFPGIEWSRSGSEAFRYILGRVRPDAEARRIRNIDTANAVWAKQSSWHGLPQRYRILRWLISRPTRPATMYVVRETLAQPLQLDSPHPLAAQ